MEKQGKIYTLYLLISYFIFGSIGLFVKFVPLPSAVIAAFRGICGASFIFKPSDQDGVRKHIPVRGLNPAITYSVEFYEHKEQNFVATGRELMENGFEIEINEVCGSDIVFFVAK